MATVVAGANKTGAISALAVRGDGDVPASTNQRAGVSALTAGVAAGLGGTSSSITTGTSGSAAFTLAAKTGCGVSIWVVGAGVVVSAVAAGPNESAVNDSVTPVANNNASASHMTVCFIAASPKQSNKKIGRIPEPGIAAHHSFKINSGRLEAD